MTGNATASGRRPGICYALTDDGVELPVIDVTNPAFRLSVTAEELDRSLLEYTERMKREEHIPRFLRRFLQILYGRRSALVRGIMDSEGGFLDGMHTYLLKLGARNLVPGYASSVDQKVAESFPALLSRIRLQEAAQRIAAAAAPALAARPGSPLHFVNIAGGTACDSLNALILLRREGAVLPGRPIHIHILDLRPEAPSFGKRSLAALGADGGPLHGLSVSMDTLLYDWADVRILQDLLQTIEPGAVVAASSEGGLFQYGSDAQVRDNLEALRAGTPSDTRMVGSVTWDSPLARLSKRFSQLSARDFTRENFERLAHAAGWNPAPGIADPINQVVTLAKSIEKPVQV